MNEEERKEKRRYKSLTDMPERHVIRLSSLPKDVSKKIRQESIELGISEQAVVNIILCKHYAKK